MKPKFYFIYLSVLIGLLSCKSEAQLQEEKRIIEAARILSEQNAKKAAEEQRIADEKAKQEQELYNRYIGNSLRTGASPYGYCYGNTRGCDTYGCSEVYVTTPSNSDVLVSLKRNGEVFQHAYIRANSTYKFEVPNGTYQPFFYYGKGWYPEKYLKKTQCGDLIGGFLENEHVGKDDPQRLIDAILQYELILQVSGNFNTKGSSISEAF